MGQCDRGACQSLNWDPSIKLQPTSLGHLGKSGKIVLRSTSTLQLNRKFYWKHSTKVSWLSIDANAIRWKEEEEYQKQKVEQERDVHEACAWRKSDRKKKIIAYIWKLQRLRTSPRSCKNWVNMSNSIDSNNGSKRHHWMYHHQHYIYK